MYPTISQQRQKCFDRLAYISEDQSEILAEYYASLNAEKINHIHRERTDMLWEKHEKLKNEYAKTYASCSEVIKPQR